MDDTNKLILRLASFQAAILHNANCYDEDEQDTWQALKDDYDALKLVIDNYIEKYEKE